MGLHDATGTQARFRGYAANLASVLGHADRVRSFEDYCIGLLAAEGRKSVEPLAAAAAPHRTAAQHQWLLHFVSQAPWSDAALLGRVRERVLPSLTRDEPIQAWIIDGFPKKGRHSVGVALQYCGQRGKQDNCQVAVSLSVATHRGSLPIGYRLYLPKDWADDPIRRAETGVPDDTGVPDELDFQTKPEIALQQMRQALADGVPPAVVLMDPAHGNDSKLRAGISAWSPLRGRHPAHDAALAARRGATATVAQAWPRPACHPPVARCDASAGLRPVAGGGTAARGLAADRMARRQQRASDLALCAPAGASGARRRQAPRTGAGGVADDRVA